jgi:macrodomain Ter protein organizer (MatP/YcbG family)
MFPLVDSIGHQLDLTYPDLSVEEIVLAIKYLIDGEMGGSVIIYEDEVLEESKFTKDAEEVGEKINSWIEAFMSKKHMNFEIVEIIYVFDELIRGFRGSESEDQFILIPESDEDDEE